MLIQVHLSQAYMRKYGTYNLELWSTQVYVTGKSGHFLLGIYTREW